MYLSRFLIKINLKKINLIETLENENNLQTGDSTDNDEDAAPKNDRLAQTIQKINQNRESLTVSMEKNAEKMRNRHNHARKTVVTYTVDYLVSVHVSAIDRSGSDVTRLPAKIIQIKK